MSFTLLPTTIALPQQKSDRGEESMKQKIHMLVIVDRGLVYLGMADHKVVANACECCCLCLQQSAEVFFTSGLVQDELRAFSLPATLF